jgi:hypothetical protein
MREIEKANQRTLYGIFGDAPGLTKNGSRMPFSAT